MEEFFKAVNQFGLSISLMLVMIAALFYWIVKKTAPKELIDFQTEIVKKALDEINKTLDDLADGMDRLGKITENNVRATEIISNTMNSQNQALTDIAKHLEVIKYALQIKMEKKR